MVDGVDGPERDADVVPHQSLVEEVVDERLDGVTAENTAIASFVAITGGEAPTEAEFNALGAKVNLMLVAMRNSKIIPLT